MRSGGGAELARSARGVGTLTSSPPPPPPPRLVLRPRGQPPHTNTTPTDGIALKKASPSVRVHPMRHRPTLVASAVPRPPFPLASPHHSAAAANIPQTSLNVNRRRPANSRLVNS
jgi:hypothetical protein